MIPINELQSKIYQTLNSLDIDVYDEVVQEDAVEAFEEDYIDVSFITPNIDFVLFFLEYVSFPRTHRNHLGHISRISHRRLFGV